MTIADELRTARANLTAMKPATAEIRARRDEQISRIDRLLENAPSESQRSVSPASAIHGPVTGPAPDEQQGQGDHRKNATSDRSTTHHPDAR